MKKESFGKQPLEPLAKLRSDMEAAIGRKMYTPKDFEYLSKCIFEKTHQNISSTTLKRLYGYLSESVEPRRSSLNLMAQFLDYADWDDYCAQGQATETPQTRGSRLPYIALTVSAIAILLCVIAMLFLYKGHSAEKHIIRQGERFATYDDYLKLFGIYDIKEPWGEPLPHHEHIIVWGPEYHHPHWHNEGDREQLLPTIREYYTPIQDLLKTYQWLTNTLNVQRYHDALRKNDLRITFMKNLKDTCFVFLGVYRLNKEKTDTTSLLWERVADEVDLNNLDYLEQLRN